MSQLIQAIKARQIFQSLGGKVAAGYLKNRHFTFDEARLALGLRKRFND